MVGIALENVDLAAVTDIYESEASAHDMLRRRAFGRDGNLPGPRNLRSRKVPTEAANCVRLPHEVPLWRALPRMT